MLSSIGVGSGIDIRGLIDQLLIAEGQPVAAQIDTKELNYTSDVSAYGQLQSTISALSAPASKLSDRNSFTTKTASSSDSKIVSVSTQNGAQVGSHRIEVSNLAESQTLSSAVFSSASDIIGTGTITIQYGTLSGGNFSLNTDKSADIFTINSDNNTVQGIADTINESENSKVQASVVNDGSGFRLVLTSKDTGTENSMRISISDDDTNNDDTSGLSQLAYRPENPTPVTNLSETVPAEDATFTFDGIAITKSSNEITDVLQNVTLTLKGESVVGEKETISISQSTGTASGNINGLISAYNTFIQNLDTLGKFNTETENGGPLVGDPMLRSVRSEITRLFTGAVNGITRSAAFQALIDIGISSNQNGTLTVNNDKLTSALKDDVDAVMRLFADFGEVEDSQIIFEGSSDNTKVGTYDINITQLATQGTEVGSAAANTTITAGVNDTLVIEVGGSSATITLAAGTYTAATLAAEAQTKINAASNFQNEGKSVTVTENSGVITITAAEYGSESTVDITGGNGETDFLGAAATATAGVDVAGTIGGFAATGAGQVLTGAGDVVGLVLTISGGSTGNRGSIEYSRGIATDLAAAVTRMTGSDSGISTRIAQLNKNIEGLADQRSALEARLAVLEERYIRQFSAMDALLQNLNNTSSFLEQQFTALNAQGNR